MMYLIQLMEEISKNSGCTILFSHHVNKLSMVSGTGGEQGAARGASALSDGVRWQLNLTKMNKEEAGKLSIDDNMRGQFVRMEISKSNYGTPLEPVWLMRQDGGVLTKAVLGETYMKTKGAKQYEGKIEKCPE
jgi:RecA-family ATPase